MDIFSLVRCTHNYYNYLLQIYSIRKERELCFIEIINIGETNKKTKV